MGCFIEAICNGYVTYWFLKNPVWLEILFLLFYFLFRYLTLPVQLPHNDTDFGRPLYSARCISLLHLVPVLFSWDYFTDIWWSHLSIDLRRLILLQSTFVLSLTLIDCRRTICLYWFLTDAVGPDQAWRISCVWLNHGKDTVCLFSFIEYLCFTQSLSYSLLPFWLDSDWASLSEAWLLCIWFLTYERYHGICGAILIFHGISINLCCALR